jgi:hypothetical protein
MKAIYALFPDPNSAQDAFDALRHAGSSMGIDTGRIVVVSSEPFEGHDFSGEDEKTYMFPLAALGGIVGGVLGYWLASFTQTSYPLPTGGMPIVTSWTNGIVIYELTMLGAILTTLVTLLVTAGLPNWKPKLSDPEIWNGKILVGVTDPPESARAEIEAKFRQTGAVAIRDFSTES